jgi:hypothetical protein
MKFSDFFREDSPYSSMRLAAVGSTILFVPCFVFLWTWLSYWNRELTVIPDSVMWFLGVLLGVKTLQKGVEVIGSVTSRIFAPKDPLPPTPTQDVPPPGAP